MITWDAYFKGRDAAYGDQLTPEMRVSAQHTIDLANRLLSLFREKTGENLDDYGCNSGWRPAAINAATPGAAKKSLHMLCLAIDINDDDGLLDDWIMNNPHVLAQLCLWHEHPSATKGWAHVQTRPPKSGRTTFYP